MEKDRLLRIYLEDDVPVMSLFVTDNERLVFRLNGPTEIVPDSPDDSEILLETPAYRDQLIELFQRALDLEEEGRITIANQYVKRKIRTELKNLTGRLWTDRQSQAHGQVLRNAIHALLASQDKSALIRKHDMIRKSEMGHLFEIEDDADNEVDPYLVISEDIMEIVVTLRVYRAYKKVYPGKTIKRELLSEIIAQLRAEGFKTLCVDRSKRCVYSGFVYEDPRFLILWFLPKQVTRMVERGKWLPFAFQHDEALIEFVTAATFELLRQLDEYRLCGENADELYESPEPNPPPQPADNRHRKRSLPQGQSFSKRRKTRREIQPIEYVEWFRNVLREVDRRINLKSVSG